MAATVMCRIHPNSPIQEIIKPVTINEGRENEKILTKRDFTCIQCYMVEYKKTGNAIKF